MDCDSEYNKGIIMMPEGEPLELDDYDYDVFDLASSENPFDESPNVVTTQKRIILQLSKETLVESDKLERKIVDSLSEFKAKILPYLEDWEAEIFLKKPMLYSHVRIVEKDIFPISVGGKVKYVKWPAAVFEVKGLIRKGYYVDSRGIITSVRDSISGLVTFRPTVVGGGGINVNPPFGTVKVVYIDYDCTFKFVEGLGSGSGKYGLVKGRNDRDISLAMLDMIKTTPRSDVSIAAGTTLLLSGTIFISTSSVDMLTDKSFLTDDNVRDLVKISDLFRELFASVETLNVRIASLTKNQITVAPKPIDVGVVSSEYLHALCAGDIGFLPVRGNSIVEGTVISVSSPTDTCEFYVDNVASTTDAWLKKKWRRKKYRFKYSVIDVGGDDSMVNLYLSVLDDELSCCSSASLSSLGDDF